MESYKTVIVPRALKDLNSLPKQIAEKVAENIDNLGKNPRPNGCKKLKGSDGQSYRIKIKKDYRLLYTISDKEKTVQVTRILHRKDVYRY